MITTFRQSIYFLQLLSRTFRGYKKNIAAMAIFGAVVSILEGIGINSIVPLFSFIDNQQTPVFDSVSRAIQKLFAYTHLPYTLYYLLTFIAILFILKSVIYFWGQYLVSHTTANYEKNTRIELLRSFLQSNWPYLVRQKIGNLDQILIIDLGNVAGLISHISFFIFILFNFLIYSFLITNISWAVAGIALLFGITSFLFFRPIFLKTRMAVADTAKQTKELSHYVNENLIGMKTIKSFFAEIPVLKNGISYFEDLRKLKMKSEILKSVIDASLQPIGVLFILGSFLFLHKTSSIHVASFAVVVYAINKVFVNIQTVQSEAHLFNTRIPYLHSVLRCQEETISQREADMGEQPFIFKNRLKFKNINFSYDNKQSIFQGLNLDILKGEMIGLVGVSGVGKTTLVDILLRLLRPQNGDILLDGQSIEEIRLGEWRKNVGYVSQDIFLINATIFDNIRFFDESISKEQVIRSAKMSNGYDFIQDLPEKFDTIVGERGLRLSVGQRQRIALARVLTRNPEILILDEATSALDNESEVTIQKAIEGLRGKVTVIAIAHRLSTILDFDKVMVLEGGQIVEAGKPRDLLKDANSQFYKIYNLKQ